MPTTTQLPRSVPAAQGVDPGSLAAFVDALAAVPGLHSVMVLRHGHVVAEGWVHPYEPHGLHELFSLSKSFTSTAVGLAAGEGLLSVDDLLLDHLADQAPAGLDPRWGRVRLRHLLTMTAGHDVDPSDPVFSSPGWVPAFFAQPLAHEPGTHFVYSTAATYVLSAVVQKITGQRVLDYLRPRLLEPLGVEGATWEQSPQGIDTGGFGLSLRTRDIAAFGQMLLQDGLWQGRRLLPEGWVGEATRAQAPNGDPASDNDWAQGYGYQFWRCRHGAFRGDGAFGQFCVVLPEQDAVVAITSGSPDMAAQLATVWTHLLPALGDEVGAAAPAVGETRPGSLTGDDSVQGSAPAQGASGGEGALSGTTGPDDAGDERLAAALRALRLDPPAGAATSPAAARLAGVALAVDDPVWARSITLEPGPVRDTVTVDLVGHGPLRVTAGHAEPDEHVLTVRRRNPERVLLSAVWTAPDTYVLTARFVESPFVVTCTALVLDDRVGMSSQVNVSFGDTHLPTLVARIPA